MCLICDIDGVVLIIREVMYGDVQFCTCNISRWNAKVKIWAGWTVFAVVVIYSKDAERSWSSRELGTVMISLSCSHLSWSRISFPSISYGTSTHLQILRR